jgi:PRTRC genetic system protein B
MIMNRLNDLLEQRQVPEMALVVYKNDKTGSLYIESHRINEKGRMLAGSPLTLNCITELVESFSVEQGNIPHGRIPETMLYSDTRKGHERYVWYNPPGKRMMFFSKNLNIEDCECRLPGIIYDTDGEHIDIYAFTEEKPEAESILYKAPLFNVTGQKVCLGNAKINFPDNPTFDDCIAYWEKKFWLTEFSHLGGNTNPTKNNLVMVTKNSKKSFDHNELIPFEKQGKILTLNYLLK